MDQTMIIVIVIVAFLLLGCSCSCKGMKKENFGRGNREVRKSKAYKKHLRKGKKKIIKQYKQEYGMSKNQAKKKFKNDATQIQCMMDNIKQMSGANFEVALQMVNESRKKDAKKLLKICNMPKNEDSLEKIAFAVEMLQEGVWKVKDSVAIMSKLKMI